MKNNLRKHPSKHFFLFIAIVLIVLVVMEGVGLENKLFHKNDMAEYFICYYDVSIVNSLGKPDKWVCVNSSVYKQDCIKACYYVGSGGLP